MIRVLLPFHLRTLAGCEAEVEVEVASPQSAFNLIEALERKYPSLCGAILEHESRKRRPKIRFFACKEDVSHAAMHEQLPADIISGKEAFMIVGAISGG